MLNISDIRFKSAMIRSNLCDYSDAYILVKGTIIITGAGDDDAEKRLDERNKSVIFKNSPPFTKCISRINSTEIDNAQVIDINCEVNLILTWSSTCVISSATGETKFEINDTKTLCFSCNSIDSR